MAIALGSTPAHSDLPSVDWNGLQQHLKQTGRRRAARRLWPESATPALLWGIAAANVDPQRHRQIAALAALALGEPSPAAVPDWCAAAEQLADALSPPGIAPEDALLAIAWGYAMPEMARHLDERLWWSTLELLQSTSAAACTESSARPLIQLLLGGELGLSLAWRLGDLPSSQHLAAASRATLGQWLEEDASAVDALRDGGRWARVALASLVRVIPLVRRTRQPKLRRRELDAGRTIARLAVGLMRPDGSAAWSPPAAADRELWPAAADALHDPPIAAAAHWAAGRRRRARSHALSLEAELPETGYYDPDAHLAAMRASWLHRRGRLAVDFARPQFRLEIGAGKCPFVSGHWTAEVELDGRPARPSGPWEPVCWHSDDDVHYLELEQPLSKGVSLQRQLLLAREDDWLLAADAVITESDTAISYRGHLPVVDSVRMQDESETREIWILEDQRRRALAMPLELPEWRVQRAAGALASDGGGLVLRTQATGCLYAPLLLDLRPRRFRSPRTWRQLTVAEERRIVAPREAAGYRVQIGGDQWLLYRTLAPAARRTLLGKNLISDFYAGRFDAGDGSLEELVSVETDE